MCILRLVRNCIIGDLDAHVRECQDLHRRAQTECYSQTRYQMTSTQITSESTLFLKRSRLRYDAMIDHYITYQYSERARHKCNCGGVFTVEENASLSVSNPEFVKNKNIFSDKMEQ